VLGCEGQQEVPAAQSCLWDALRSHRDIKVQVKNTQDDEVQRTENNE
jgi:hypothetical protein